MAKNIKNYEHFVPAAKLRPDMPGANKRVLVTSIEQLVEIFKTKHEFISLDFETSGLSPEVDFIVGYSFAFDPHTGYYVPVKHAQGLSFGKVVLDMLYEIVMKAKRVFLYNARFDMRFFEWAGYDLSNMKYFDVMKGIWLADSNIKMPSLKWAERHFLGWDPSTFEQTLGDAVNFYHLDPEQGYEYACDDACGTFALVPTAVKYYKEARLSGQLDNEILYPLMKWENEGIRIDIDYLNAKIEELSPKLYEIEHEIYSEVGYQFALKSPKQLGDALQSRGITTGQYTKGGQMKTDINTLSALSSKLGDTPETRLLTNIVKYSKLIKLLNSFFVSLRDEAVRMGGRCRFSYIDCNVPTGRLSSGSDKKNPFYAHMNVQAISKPHPKMWYVHDGNTITDEELEPGEVRVLDWVFSTTRKSDKWEEGFDQSENVRSAFLPEEGHYWVSIDFNAQELRIPAALSGEPAWTNAFVSGTDPHKSTAIAIWGEENYNKDKRKLAKVCNFGLQYGGNKYTLQEKLRIDDLDECEKIANDWRRGLPTLHAWQDQIVRRAKKTGTTYTYFGRPRRVRFYMNSSDGKTRAFGVRTIKNSAVQGCGADLTKIGMLKLWKKLLDPELKTGCRFLNTIHDEVNISIPKDPSVFYKYLAIARQCMRIQVPGWPFPMETGIEIGDSQGRTWAFIVEDDGSCRPKWEDVPQDEVPPEIEEEGQEEEEDEFNIFMM